MPSVMKSLLDIFIRSPRWCAWVLIDAEVFGVPIKDQPLTRGERNVEQISTAVVPLAQETANEAWPLSNVFHTVGKSFPLRTSSVHNRAKSFAKNYMPKFF